MTDVRTFAGLAAAFFTALAGGSALRAFSLRRQLLDQPNERSLHKTPVPRLGGVAIVGGFWSALAIYAIWPGAEPGARNVVPWALASLPVAVLGLVDDLRPLRATTRLLLQLAAASAFCVAIGPPACVPVTRTLCVTAPPLLVTIGSVLVLVGLLNLYNFMDGMDGLAGTQAALGGLALGVVFATRQQSALALASFALCAASSGFLAHNLPPARMFMGDAGSTFLGFSFGAIALVGARLDPAVPAPVFLLTLAPLLLDGGGTLLRRALQGEAVWQAHRTHLYQRAVTAGRTHRQVLVVYALWMAAAGVCGLLADRASPAGVGLLVLAMLGALLGVWAWVRHLERAAGIAPPGPAR